MRIILLGAPGAGKGTQAGFICEKFKLVKISSGDMLRSEINAKTEIGQKFASILKSGGLVEEDVVSDLVIKKIKSLPNSDNFLLDGFPRTINQASSLEAAGIGIDIVLSLEVPDQEIIKRLGGRRIHLASGRVYHILFNPPKIPGLDDSTQEPLIQRDDDKEHIIKQRLEVYHNETKPLIDWYKAHNVPLKVIDGNKSLQQVTAAIFQYLEPKP